jgi:hypothetical protein
MDSLSDLNFSNWLLKSTSSQSQSRALNYSECLSDSMASGRLSSICAGCKDKQRGARRANAETEARSAVVLYSMLIYHLYPNVPALRKKIDSDPHLRSNFERLKGWLDSNGGGKIAEDFYREMSAHQSKRGN